MRKMSGDASAAAVSVTRTDPFPFAGEEALLCGANAMIAAAAMCLQIRPSCAMRTWKSGQVQEPLPCGSSLTLYAVPLLLVTMNSGKSPATRRRLVFISSTAWAQRLPAFDCSRVSARDADCGSTTCAATDMWFSPFVDLWLEWPIPLYEIGSPAIQPVWIGVGVPPNFLWIKVCGFRGLWVK